MKQEERIRLLTQKLAVMKEYEEVLYQKGILSIAGVDEVGRGPLAGPVVAAAVILPRNFDLLGVDDSKKLSPKKREELDIRIREQATAYAIGIVDNETIDRINILEATKLAMKLALQDIEKVCPIEHILIDALTLKAVLLPQTGIIKGDSKSVSIAAASIIAKVARDQMMEEYDKIYPGYGFFNNKGYGTPAHYEGIEALGACPIHRRSFLKFLDK
jgi:ribonuclease HII